MVVVSEREGEVSEGEGVVAMVMVVQASGDGERMVLAIAMGTHSL